MLISAVFEAILAVSAVFEVNALRVVLELSKRSIKARGDKFSLRALLYEFQESKDPSTMTIMVEDSAALLGIAIAGIGIFLSNQTGNTIYDSISSLSIGAILMAFAFFLARENKGLLIGEAISTIRTMHLAPKDVLVAIEVNLINGLDTDEVETVIDNIERNVKQAIPYVNPAKVFVELEKDRVSDLYKRKSK
jgi:divalent metal cation (Fe/Co/Zn/Cd) transporter